MADTAKVNLEENSKYRVALELAERILSDEIVHKPDVKERIKADPRTYWLNLYAQCRKVVVDGWDAKAAQKE